MSQSQKGAGEVRCKEEKLQMKNPLIINLPNSLEDWNILKLSCSIISEYVKVFGDAIFEEVVARHQNRDEATKFRSAMRLFSEPRTLSFGFEHLLSKSGNGFIAELDNRGPFSNHGSDSKMPDWAQSTAVQTAVNYKQIAKQENFAQATSTFGSDQEVPDWKTHGNTQMELRSAPTNMSSTKPVSQAIYGTAPLPNSRLTIPKRSVMKYLIPKTVLSNEGKS